MTLQLICINYGNFEDAVKAAMHCVLTFDRFEEITLLHPNPKYFFEKEVHKHINVIKSKSPTQNECFTKELPQYITCDHVMGIQWDGFIVRPDLWNPSWLQYDWIAPPWPLQNIPNPDHRVGSGGFCMFSKRMSQLWPKILDLDSNNDWQIGVTKRAEFEAQGMKYAPLEVAAKFGKEHDLEDLEIPEGESFGFHDLRINPEYREKYRKAVYV